MPAGCQLRELPDGGVEFVLDDPVLAALVVGGGVTLRFGTTDLVVTEPCELEVDGIGHRLDPGTPGSLGPLLGLYPGTARWLHASPSGELILVLQQGQRLVVPGPLTRTCWTVGPADDTGR